MIASYENLCDLIHPHDGNVISVIGAGGKHTLMYRLSDELVAAGRQVVITSTTNLHRNAQRCDMTTLVAAECPQWPKSLAESISGQGRAVLVASNLGANMYRGFDPQTIEQIRAAVPDAVILAKADGARKRLIKAPGDDEPAHPPRAELCILILSLAAIGRALEDACVHRIERVRKLTSGDRISPQTLIDVITGRGGYVCRLPAKCRAVLYLSCCNTPQALEHACEIFSATEDFFDRQICGDTIEGKFHTSPPKSDS